MKAGRRDLVVFLHAVGGDASFWAPQVEALAGEYQTLALDLARPADDVSMAAFAGDVARAVRSAGFARAHLVGLSMGGVVALETFRRYRDVVRSLTLANTWAFLPDAAARLAWIEAQLATRTVAEFSRETLAGLFAKDADRAVVEHGMAVEGRKDKGMYLACWRAMLRSDHRALLPAIDVPVLLLGGALDPTTPTDPLLTSVRDAVPTARLVDIPGASHFSNLDRPAEFTAALRAHLRSARSRHGDALAPDERPPEALPAGTTAEQLLRLLPLRGVELFASNSGTDFTPLIDALAKLEGEGARVPRVVMAPHENTAVALAHGHALLSRRPQAVMAHVHVGTANIGLGLINARRARVPLLALAGRTPYYEEGVAGARTNFVQWGQESYDQAGSFREFTKWDYELRGPHALDTVVDRALAIAESDPAGPVYLTLPKEPLCEPAPERAVAASPRQTASRASAPEAFALATAREWIARAKRPLIVTADAGRHAGAPEALVRFAVAAGAGVVEHGKRNFFNFPTEHPHHLGFEPNALVRDADLVIAVECPVPWIPAFAKLASPPRVIQIAVDPLFSDLPLRGFPSDLSLAGDPTATLRALADFLDGDVPSRTEALARVHAETFDGARARARREGERARISKGYLSYCVGEAVDDEVVVFNEYDLDPLLVPRRCADSWFENSVASGLGWSLGAALGAKIAAPERTVLVTLGDGSYLFNTPLSAHYVAAAEGLPIAVVVFNDAAWSTIKRSTKGSHPQGAAVARDRFALCDFSHAVELDRVAAACGGIGLRVESPAELPDALREVLRLVRTGDRHVLLDVRCERDG